MSGHFGLFRFHDYLIEVITQQGKVDPDPTITSEVPFEAGKQLPKIPVA